MSPKPTCRVLLATVVLSIGIGAELNRGDTLIAARSGPRHSDGYTQSRDQFAENIGATASQVTLADVPVLAGRLPAEFERQVALLIAGHQLTDYAPELFVELVSHTRGRVELVVLVSDGDEYEIVKELLLANAIAYDHVRFVEVPHDSMWVRDYGPIVVQPQKGPAMIVDAGYQTERPNDDLVPEQFAWLAGVPTARLPLRLDGGNLLSNGDGLALTTSRLLDENATNEEQEREVPEVLRRVCGLTNVVILEPLADEPTGHVDMFATFTSLNTVVVGAFDPAIDPENAAILDRNAERLSSTWTTEGRLQVIRVPMPPHADDVWRSYTNVVYANGALLVPTFRDVDQAGGAVALQTFANLLPQWTVVGIDASQVVEFSGALHCITMNLGPLQRVFEFPQPQAHAHERFDDFDDITFALEAGRREESRRRRLRR